MLNLPGLNYTAKVKIITTFVIILRFVYNFDNCIYIVPVDIYGTKACRSISLIPLRSEIKKVDAQIRSTQFSRLVALADVITRYTAMVFKIKGDQISLLRSSTLRFIVTRGGSLTLSQ